MYSNIATTKCLYFRKKLLFYISKVAAKVMLDESIKTMEEEMKNFDELQRVEDPPRKIN